MHINCANVSPYSTPIVISKKGVSPSGDLTIEYHYDLLNQKPLKSL